MKPLIEIQTVPIAIEYKTTPAKIERAGKITPAQRHAMRTGARPPQLRKAVNRDTFEYSGHRPPSIENPGGTMRANVQFIDAAGNSKSVAYNATARLTRDGQVAVDLQRLDGLAPAGAASAAGSVANAATGANNGVSALPESISLTYQIEKLRFEMRQHNDGYSFTPGGVEFSISEYPRVIVEYTGSPFYVPPSADPEYEPIDTMA